MVSIHKVLEKIENAGFDDIGPVRDLCRAGDADALSADHNQPKGWRQ